MGREFAVLPNVDYLVGIRSRSHPVVVAPVRLQAGEYLKVLRLDLGREREVGTVRLITPRDPVHLRNGCSIVVVEVATQHRLRHPSIPGMEDQPLNLELPEGHYLFHLFGWNPQPGSTRTTGPLDVMDLEVPSGATHDLQLGQ